MSVWSLRIEEFQHFMAIFSRLGDQYFRYIYCFLKPIYIDLLMMSCSWGIKKTRYTWRDHYNCDPYAGSKMVCVSGSRKTCLTTQNAAIIEIHVNYLNSIGGFHLFSPSLTSSVAYHDQHLIFIPLEVGIAVALLTSRWMKITVFNKIPRCNISACS